MDSRDLGLIKCEDCGDEGAEDYVPVYSKDEPIRVICWLCMSCCEY